MNKIINFILLLIISNSILVGCKTMQTSKTTTVVKDSVVVTTVIDTVNVSVANDTVRFDSLINHLLFLQGEIVKQQENTQEIINDTLMYQKKKLVQQLEKEKKKVINDLTKGVYSDTSYNVPLYIEFKGSDSTFVEAGYIKVIFENGKLGHRLNLEKVTVPTKHETTNIEVKRKITLWAWLRDDKTIILLFVLIIMMIIIIKKK